MGRRGTVSTPALRRRAGAPGAARRRLLFASLAVPLVSLCARSFRHVAEVAGGLLVFGGGGGGSLAVAQAEEEVEATQVDDAAVEEEGSGVRAGTCPVTPPVSEARVAKVSSAEGGKALLQTRQEKTSVRSVGGVDKFRTRLDMSLHGSGGELAVTEISQKPKPDANVVITVATIKCAQSVFAPDGECPADCPYWAAEVGKGKSCRFQCLTKAQCGTLDPDARIADPNSRICRKCRVPGCKTCSAGTADTCAKCEIGYSLGDAGECSSDYFRIFISVLCIVLVLGTFVLAWLVFLQFAKVTNPEGLREGLEFRSRLKLHIPKDKVESGERQLWPISTNLHAVAVAGPGLVLHMNFQVAMIIWSCVIIVVWVLLAYSTHPELLALGLYPANTPQQLCAVTLRGKEMQRDMMWAKVLFIVLAYLGTFAGSLAYAVFQLRTFQKIDDDTSMTDFAAICVGLPQVKGSERVEEKLRSCIERACGQKVVGVSVCWDYKTRADEVQDALESELLLAEPDAEPELPDQKEDSAVHSLADKAFGWISELFGFSDRPAEKKVVEEDEIKGLVAEIDSTDSAFAVFENESARDAAVEAARELGGVSFEGARLTLAQETCEPDTVRWECFDVTMGQFVTRSCVGVLIIILALVIWAVGFYLPFAYYSASFSYASGEEPGFLQGFLFSMLVVAGNQIMYFLCGEISERAGFRFNDQKEVFYIALYTLACFLNLCVDMTLEFFLGYRIMIAGHVHTADGRLLEDLSSFQEIFETFVMQKSLGQRLFAYCFTGTFLLPFIAEPIGAIYAPYHLMKLLLRTHPQVRGRDAEKSMEFFCPMDMGRYGDIMLNVMLSSLIFFFPSGTTLKMFIAFAVSHVYIYAYDQYRILRCVPAFNFASNFIDRYAQAILAIPCGFILVCIIFKSNGMEHAWAPKVKGYQLGALCAAAFLGHLAVHWLALVFVIPRFKRAGHALSEVSYPEAAAGTPCTWFNANPVHCLRSKYLYGDNPPCQYCVNGKEHLLKSNPAIGCYYEDSGKTAAEEYNY